MGYDRTAEISRKTVNGRAVARYRWMPTHIAIVPVPADTKVGVGRAQITESQNMSTPSLQTEVTSRHDLLVHDNPHCEQELTELKGQAVLTDMSLKDYGTRALEVVQKNRDRRPSQLTRVLDTEIGMSKREIEGYSIHRAIRTFVKEGRFDGPEKDYSDQAQKNSGQQAEGLMVPLDVASGNVAPRLSQASTRFLLRRIRRGRRIGAG